MEITEENQEKWLRFENSLRAAMDEVELGDIQKAQIIFREICNKKIKGEE